MKQTFLQGGEGCKLCFGIIRVTPVRYFQPSANQSINSPICECNKLQHKISCTYMYIVFTEKVRLQTVKHPSSTEDGFTLGILMPHQLSSTVHSIHAWPSIRVVVIYNSRFWPWTVVKLAPIPEVFFYVTTPPVVMSVKSIRRWPVQYITGMYGLTVIKHLFELTWERTCC